MNQSHSVFVKINDDNDIKFFLWKQIPIIYDKNLAW